MGTRSLSEEFFKHFAKKVRAGESSALSGLEAVSIQIAFAWLLTQYTVTEIKASAEDRIGNADLDDGC